MPPDPADAIPYDQVDEEIRDVVRAMNRFPGIRTSASCAGHPLPDAVYAALDRRVRDSLYVSVAGSVTFAAATQDDLCRLLRALPCVGWTPAFLYDSAAWTHVWTRVFQLTPTGEVLYLLSFEGFPLEAQRTLLVTVAHGLTLAADRLPEHSRPPSADASAHTPCRRRPSHPSARRTTGRTGSARAAADRGAGRRSRSSDT